MKTGRRVVVQCKRCGQAMLKWQRFPVELDVSNPFPFDRVCGACLTQKEVDLHYGRLKNRQKIFGKNQSKGENGGKGNAGTGLGSTGKVRIEPATVTAKEGSPSYVRECDTMDCACYPYRMGKNPARLGKGKSAERMAFVRSKKQPLSLSFNVQNQRSAIG